MLSRFSRVLLCATLWTVACQAPLSMEFSRQEYWGGLPFPPPGDLPDSGTEPASLTSPPLTGGFFTTGTTWLHHYLVSTGGDRKRKKQRGFPRFWNHGSKLERKFPLCWGSCGDPANTAMGLFGG